MTRALLSIALHVYGLAAVVYLAHLVRQWAPLAIVGRIVVGAGLLLHGASMGITFAAQGGMPVGMAQGFSLVAWLLLAIFFFLDLRYRMPVIGAFLMPVALAVLVPGLLIEEAVRLPEGVKAPLLPLHVAIALLGLAAFGVASGVAVMYLLLERQMKGKKFGVLFSRLPPLGFLDELNRRLVVWGFIALSFALVTGAFFMGESGVARWGVKEIVSLVAWLGFGAQLHARFFAGWQGKRVAVLTMACFVALLVSFLSAYDPSRGSGVH